METYDIGSLRLPASIIAIGAFDGVHKGHQELILKARQQAEALDIPLVIYTFDPPPRIYFQKVKLLTPLSEKIERLSRLGAQYAVVAPFNREYASRKAEDFIGELKLLNPMGIWVGNDFKFGAERKGDVDLLTEKFSVYTLEPVRCEAGEVISSSRIRRLYNDNLIADADQLLGWNVSNTY